MNQREKSLKMPKRPLLSECHNERHYLKMFQIYKKERRQWINQNKPKHKLAILSKNKLKIIKNEKKYQDKLNRSKNDDKYKQKTLF